MQVLLSQVTKRYNSTYRPSGGRNYDVTLKEPCSVLKPRLMIKWNGVDDGPINYNIVKIPKFNNRYYWITNWTYEDRCWVADCAVDVLATYKTEIQTAQKYILRAAFDSNPLVIDDKYPATGDVKINRYLHTGRYNWAKNYNDGTYIVGIVGQNNTFSAGGIGFVSMSATQIQTMLDAAFGLGVTDPYQYINSVIWLPFRSISGVISGTTTVNLGTYATGVTASTLSKPVIHVSWTELVNTSPAGAGTPMWKNIAPFVRYVLCDAPFGTFELDSTLLYDHTTLEYELYCDVTNGDAYLEIYATGSDSGNNRGKTALVTSSAKIGVVIPIAGIYMNAIDTVTGIIGGAASVAAAFAYPSPSSIGGAVSGVGNAIKSCIPSAVGGGIIGGGVAGLEPYGFTEVRIYEPVEEDITEQGRPLCKTDVVGIYTGYVLLADGDLPIEGTPEEKRELAALLTGGFFNE